MQDPQGVSARFIFAVLALCGTPLIGTTTAQDSEPARMLVLSVNGKEFVIQEGKKTKVSGALGDASVSIRPAGYRVFHHDGLSFHYPVELDFHADHDGEYKTWTISGQDSDLDILVMPGDPESYIKQSVSLQVAVTDNPLQIPRIKKDRFSFRDRELKTYRYTVAWDAETSLETWAVELPPKHGNSRVLMFGLYFDDDGPIANECVKLKEMVFDSLAF